MTTQTDIDTAVAFARKVVEVAGVIGPLVVPGAAPAILLGVQVATGALDEVPNGEALWADIQAAASGAAPPSPEVMAASVAAAEAANTTLEETDKAAIAANEQKG